MPSSSLCAKGIKHTLAISYNFEGTTLISLTWSLFQKKEINPSMVISFL